MKVIVNILIVTAAVLALIFPLAYSRSNWTKYLPGRALMIFSVIVALTLILSSYRAITGFFPPDWVRGVSFLAILVGLALMDYALLREQHRDRAAIRELNRLSADTLRKD